MRNICIAIALMITATASAELRKWTTTAGPTLEAEFVELQLGTVYLKTADGSVKKINKSKLIQEDQELATKMASPFYGKKKAAPKTTDAIYDLFGKNLTNAQKKRVPVDALSGKTIGIYFSAHWCPPCRAFTPELVKFHKRLAKEGKSFEIVFVSSDRDKDSMFNYMKEMDMPWLALPFGDSHKKELAEKFHVSGIPKLVIIDPQGNLITEDGRRDVSGHGDDAYAQWK
ncbi:thioredoxin family protein [Pontiella sulfatireligans]|uniref:Thiol:disulfide interchange protein TlpA n=1 Tax=Pontiella sulfatireligans TaxID=2750658 RepID=A0A6C2UJV2_9BACT|nr:thioredoxin family protein [Pontiella sulfatireligans]VGO20378.1 Thiol:disulfide interchange protein TlpA [Pontiella sulfatireligans]